MSTRFCSLLMSRASTSSEAMMHFPPVSDFPNIFKNFSDSVEIFLILPFPEKFLHFHPPKFLMTFFSHRPQIWHSPYFSCFSNISPLFRENYYYPLLLKMAPPCFRKIHLLLHTLCVFR